MRPSEASRLACGLSLCTLLVACKDSTGVSTPPGAPSGVVAATVSNTAVDVSWADNSDDEGEFRIEREAVGGSGAAGSGPAADGAFVLAGVVDADVTTFRDTGLQPSAGYRYRVVACNENGCSDPSDPSAAVTTFETLAIETTELPAAVENQAYEATLAASGGDGSVAWSVPQGELPPGLSLAPATGVISGSPSSPGRYDFTVGAEGAGQAVTRALSIFVEDILPPVVTTTELPDGVVGSAYAASLVAGEGDGAYAWRLATGSLPPGLALSADGTLSGVPTAPGSYVFGVEVTSAGMTASADLSITVLPALVVSTTSLPDAVEGRAYSAVLEATGGDGAYTWSMASGSLPAGLGLDASTGEISGTPASAGTAAFTIQVSSGDGQTAQRALSIRVLTEAVTVTTTRLPDGQLGTPYNQTLTATGGTGTYTWAVVAGALPDGLSLD
ncbi:MAG TPA: putative Ig domain-containing protein, partial [Longimicrobiales bacterium]|nr:putative Ig domain-containing protein [Longimicrobiales bacterium]